MKSAGTAKLPKQTRRTPEGAAHRQDDTIVPELSKNTSDHAA